MRNVSLLHSITLNMLEHDFLPATGFFIHSLSLCSKPCSPNSKVNTDPVPLKSNRSLFKSNIYKPCLFSCKLQEFAFQNLEFWYIPSSFPWVHSQGTGMYLLRM